MIQGLYTLGHTTLIDFKLLTLAQSIISEDKTQQNMRNKDSEKLKIFPINSTLKRRRSRNYHY